MELQWEPSNQDLIVDKSIKAVVEKLREKVPLDSFIKIAIDEDDFGYFIKCLIKSKLISFSDEVFTENILDGLWEVESKITTKIENWKKSRNFYYHGQIAK